MSNRTERRREWTEQCVRTVVWGMLYADDAGFVSKSTEGLATIIRIIVEFGLDRVTEERKQKR